MPDLSAMLERGPVVCAEGYLFECERRAKGRRQTRGRRLRGRKIGGLCS